MIQFATSSLEPERGLSQEQNRARIEAAEALGDEIARLSAHISAAMGRLLEMIRRFDESEGWHDQGFRNCAAWLGWRTGIGPVAARERVRVARALGDLPVMSEAIAAGKLSYSVARALTRIATPENEADLVEAARHTPASDLERLVRAWRVADQAVADERDQHAARYLTFTTTETGRCRVTGDLDPEVGAVLRKAIEYVSEQLHGRTAGEPGETAGARRHDAAAAMAEAILRNGLAPEDGSVVHRAERFQVVVHASAETVSGAQTAVAGATTDIEHGGSVSAETARRLACDAAVVEVKDGSGTTGAEAGPSGRRRRTVPAAVRRALNARDRRCRFPGCESRFCDAHHVRHWADGGESTLDNLVLLCRHHHRRVHEDGWRVEGAGDCRVRFFRPDGSPQVEVPIAVGEAVSPELETVNRDAHQPAARIDAWTATSRWLGDPFDIDWALFVLSQGEPSGARARST